VLAYMAKYFVFETTEQLKTNSVGMFIESSSTNSVVFILERV